MDTPFTRRASLCLLAVAALLPAACDDPVSTPTFDALPPPASADAHPNALQVVSWNVFLGADIAPVLTANFNDVPAVVALASAIWNQVQASNMAERAAAVVDRLAEERPAVVGLQEVFQFVEVNGDFQPVSQPLDMLALIQAEIAARGLPYQTAATQTATEAALPISLDLSVGAVDRYVAFKDRIATLVRTDVDVQGVAQDRYIAAFPLTDQVVLRRGWIRVDVQHTRGVVHVFNTHLEGQSLAPIQAMQVDELVGSLTAGLPGTVILMGDLNSDAAASAGAPSWTPTYGTLLDAGFVDAWIETRPRPRVAGFTCCQHPGLQSPDELDERIDFVLVRQPPGREGPALEGRVRMWRVGEEPGDRTSPSGLWPSDHAGLSAELVLPPGLTASASPVDPS